MKIFTNLFVIMLFWGHLASTIGGGDSSQSQAQAGDSKGGAADKNEGSNAKPKTTITCNQDLLWSYKLKGRPESSLTEKFLLCPDVKHNCCNKIDQQKIFHYVNDVMPVKHLEYQTKVEQALTRLEKLHKRIKKTIFDFPGDMKRKRWCAAQHRSIINFPYKPLFEKLQEQIEYGAPENLSQNQSFYCVLCDGENHQYFNVEKSPFSIILDSHFCKKYIEERHEEINLMNVELINYMKMVQNVVDCVHYTRSYKLNFFDENKLALVTQTTECLQNLESPEFLVKCQPLCKQLSINQIIPIAEGDFVFLNNAVTLFEKFFSYQERGQFISMKLRLFFKKFEIPKTMTRLSESRFMRRVEGRVKPKLPGDFVKPARPAPLNLSTLSAMDKFWSNNPGLDPTDNPHDPRLSEDLDDEEDDQQQKGKKKNEKNKKVEGNQNKKKDKIKNRHKFAKEKIRGPREDKWGRIIEEDDEPSLNNVPRRSLRLERALSMHESYDPEYESLLINKASFDPLESIRGEEEPFGIEDAPMAVDDAPFTTAQRVLEEVPLKNVHLGEGRKLQATGSQASGAQQSNSQQNGVNQNNGNAQNQNDSIPHILRKKRTARLVFDRDLFRFYDEITIKKPEKKQQTIFRVKKQPINISKIERVFMEDKGIDPIKYQSKRFNLPKALFYKELFTYREPDKRDPNLLFMLADFSKEYKKLAKKVLKREYLIDPHNYKFKFERLAKPKEPKIPEPPLITWSSLQSNPGPAPIEDQNLNPEKTQANGQTITQQAPQSKRLIRKKK